MEHTVNKEATMLDTDLQAKLEEIVAEYIRRDLKDHARMEIMDRIDSYAEDEKEANALYQRIFDHHLLDNRIKEDDISDMAWDIAEDVGLDIHDQVIQAIQQKAEDIVDEAVEELKISED